MSALDPAKMDESAFRRAVLDPAAEVPAGLRAPDGGPAGRRFDVYRNNVVVGLARALADGFPALESLLGANNFGILAQNFLRAHPPRSPVISQYGQAMPEFLERFAPVQSLPYLPDIARLELARRASYHAADAEPMDPARLTALPPERLERARLRLAPALRLLR